MTHASLFTGIGACELAAERLSRPRWRIDRRTLAYRDTRAERFARIAHAVLAMLDMQRYV